MKKLNIILAVLLAISLLCLLVVTFNAHSRQKSIDEMFANAYHNLTLNMLNETVEGLSEDAVHMYKVENTRWSAILINFYHQSSYDNGNFDLNLIVAMLSQSAGYAATSKVNMDLELYHKLRDVPTDNFGNKEILKEAREALDAAFEK